MTKKLSIQKQLKLVPLNPLPKNKMKTVNESLFFAIGGYP